MMVVNRVLFIAWDGPYVTYLESLFLPIFQGLAKAGFEFHIIQFSWASQDRVDLIGELCRQHNIRYTHSRIQVRPHPVIGKLIALVAARYKVAAYIKTHQINVIMPRGLMPAKIVLSIINQKLDLQLVYDADGLQIEERVDFMNLRTGSFRHKRLKKIEREVIKKADIVLTRSRFASEYLMKQYGRGNYFRVINGRDEGVFNRPSREEIAALKKNIGIPENAFVLVYCGTLAPQYGLPEMAKLHTMMLSKRPDSRWLVLTANIDQMKPYSRLPNVIVKTVSPFEIPLYLSMGTVGVALRKATLSMKGVAPIKLGEYLLVGLPVIASAGIGDTEDLLASYPFCHIVRDFSEISLTEACSWMDKNHDAYEPNTIRDAALQHFSLTAAAESYRKALNHLG